MKKIILLGVIVLSGCSSTVRVNSAEIERQENENIRDLQKQADVLAMKIKMDEIDRMLQIK